MLGWLKTLCQLVKVIPPAPPMFEMVPCVLTEGPYGILHICQPELTDRLEDSQYPARIQNVTGSPVHLVIVRVLVKIDPAKINPCT